MTANVLVTGPPGSGKTTVLDRVADRLAAAGYVVDGLSCPEIRADGERVGFAIVDRRTGAEDVLAHVDRSAGPSVGKYRVNVGAVDALSERIFPRARESADVVVIDEIAPMEVHSEAFVREVRETLDGETPVLAAIHQRSSSGFVGEVEDREDTELVTVSEENRDELPGRLATQIRATLERE